MEDNCSTRPLALGDIFLDVLEQMSNDESQKTYVRKVKILMDVPECAEFLSICLINAMACFMILKLHMVMEGQYLREQSQNKHKNYSLSS